MHKFMTVLAALAVFCIPVAAAHAAAQVGQAAPDFTATDINGNPFKLSDHKGKTVVLEWTNHECPFVVKHYDSGNMQKIQAAARAQGAEWVTIVSSAPGSQGHIDAATATTMLQEKGSSPSAKILDESGEIGKAYDAKTTPHMYVINGEGVLVYAGAIDDNSSPNPETIEGAKNYVLAALDDLAAGRAVATAQTQPYGCAVKYAN
jgi:peroxiredoxin